MASTTTSAAASTTTGSGKPAGTAGGTKKACDDLSAALSEFGTKKEKFTAQATSGNGAMIQSYFETLTARIRTDTGLTDNPQVKNGIEALAKLGDGGVNATTPEEFKAAMLAFGGFANSDAFNKLGDACDAV